MKPNRRVVFFVAGSTFILFVLSTVSVLTGFDWQPFNRVNLISDIISQPNLVAATVDTSSSERHVPGTKDFKLYRQAGTITEFDDDSSRASLQRFFERLSALKKTKKGKIRIAYFGDSMIEGDLLTQTLRKLLQENFGGNGVGFVPVNSPVAKFRQTVSSSCSDSWTDQTFRDKSSRVYVSGHTYSTANGWLSMTDRTISDSSATIEASLICGQHTAPFNLNVNSSNLQVKAPALINRVPVMEGPSKTLNIGIATSDLPVYGVSFESRDGIFVDNFSFRGITGVEFARIDSTFMAAVEESNAYDLIIFQYGVNLLFRPNDKNFSWYAKTILPVVQKFRQCFPKADFLVMGTADRAFRYADGYRSAVGIDSLIKVQAQLAFQTSSAFYNQYETMGGANSIVDWARQKPSLANQDYVHPNHRGAEVLGQRFYAAIVKEFNKYELSHR